MSTLAPHFFTPWDPLASRGASPDSARANQLVQEAVLEDRSFSLGERRRTQLQSLCDVMERASAPGWDGYGAAAVDGLSVAYAREFLAILPSDLPMPEVTVDPDGEVSLEWDHGPRSVFSVSIGRDGTLTYAGLFGYSKCHGVETLSQVIPMVVSEGIRRAVAGPAART